VRRGFYCEVATISSLPKNRGLCAKEPCKRDCILPKRPIFLRSLLIIATPYWFRLRIPLGERHVRRWFVLCVAVCCSVLQCVAVWPHYYVAIIYVYSSHAGIAVCCSVLQCVAVSCSEKMISEGVMSHSHASHVHASCLLSHVCSVSHVSQSRLTCACLMSAHLHPIAGRLPSNLKMISQIFRCSTRRTRILMWFIISTMLLPVLIVNPIGRILVCWKVLEIISRFLATLSGIGCMKKDGFYCWVETILLLEPFFSRIKESCLTCGAACTLLLFGRGIRRCMYWRHFVCCIHVRIVENEIRQDRDVE